ncbi:MAG: hypothetical protein AB7U86_09085 [Methylocystis sp.]|uniref:hypothetical protein n=1 Tax=Methylocystis sp. TaxID=1911079 RepID=UPI003D151804
MSLIPTFALGLQVGDKRSLFAAAEHLVRFRDKIAFLDARHFRVSGDFDEPFRQPLFFNRRHRLGDEAAVGDDAIICPPMREAENPQFAAVLAEQHRRRVAVVRSFKRVRHRLFDISVGIAQHVGDRRFAQLRVGEVQHGAWEQHALTLPLSGAASPFRRDLWVTRDDRRHALCDRLLSRFLERLAERRPRLALATVDLGFLGCGQVRQQFGVDHPAGAHCHFALELFQRRGQFWRRFENDPLRRADRNIDNRPLQHLPGVADREVAQSVEPTALHERFEIGLEIGGIRDGRVDMKTAAAGKFLACLAIKES